MSPRIGFIMTGGTIGSIGIDRLDLAWYIENRTGIDGAEILSRVPEIARFARVCELPYRRVPSHALTSADWLALARCIETALASDDLDGIVVAHGTNTLEETAFFLHLALRTLKPVVVTGAMRPASAMSADGDLNLVNAVRVAATPTSYGRGCLVVLDDAVFCARDVTKSATYRVEAFRSRDLGPLGFADADGEVVYYHRCQRDRPVGAFELTGIEDLPRVDVVVSYVGADGVMIGAAAAAGARGIVSAATGAGRPTPAEDEAFDRARDGQGVIMCLCSRVAAGRTVRSPELARRRFVSGDNLPPWKARVLLSLALTRTRDADEIQHMFDTY